MELTRGFAYDCDVLVIGGGIVGLSTAYAITRAVPGVHWLLAHFSPVAVPRPSTYDAQIEPLGMT